MKKNVKAKEMSLGDLLSKSMRKGIDEYTKGKKLTKKLVLDVSKPKVLSPRQIKMLREKLHLSQAIFAQALNISSKTVQAWESGVNKPNPLACRLLELVQKHPETFLGTVTKK